MATHIVVISGEGEGWLSGSCGPGDATDGTEDEGDGAAGVSWGAPTWGPEAGHDATRPAPAKPRSI